MPPSKARAIPEDNRSEISSIREKASNHTVLALNGRTRRIAGGPVAETSTKDTVDSAAASASAVASVTGPGQEGNTGVQWPSLEPSILHSYRHVYKLNTSTAFASPYNQLLLSRPGVGRGSPTMARRKEQRRQSKEQLATAVRKHFNGMGIQENDAVVEFLYKVKHQDKAFRLRFSPARGR